MKMVKWELKIFTTKDQAQWDALIEVASSRDVFFCRQYVSLFEELSGDAAQLFFFGGRCNYILYPYFLRSIQQLRFFEGLALDNNIEYFDIESPYGYSGPLAVISEPSCERELWLRFLERFHQYCLDANIVCEFARLNPFVGNHVPLEQLTDGVKPNNPITYLDLRVSDEELWQGFNRGNRSNINKAKRNGVEITRCAEFEHVSEFYELYTGTMQRNEAEDWYFFPLDFFQSSFKIMSDEASLFHADYNGRIIAAASFLHAGDTVHYFLGGSHGEYLSVRPNNLLMYEAIRWAKSEGYRYFNLGGGHGPDGRLAQFKAAFSKLTKMFYTYRKVHNPHAYETLCQKFISYREKMEQPIMDPGFFPLYRTLN